MTVKARVRRTPERARYDRETLYGILDEGIVCHASFSDDEGQSYNIPMIYVRNGDILYLHASVKSRIYSELASGRRACVAVTLLDGIVLAKSAFHTSLNYRSAMVFGQMSPVKGREEKLAVSEHLIEKISPDRWNNCRHPSENELKATGFLKLPIDVFSSKVRSGPPEDDPEDDSLEYPSGVIPLRLARGDPVGFSGPAADRKRDL